MKRFARGFRRFRTTPRAEAEVERVLGAVGRMKYLVPLYDALLARDATLTLRRFDDDKELLQTSLLLFEREFRDLVPQLKRLHSEEQDRELRYLVHKFRGSAANLGAVELTLIAQAAEAALDLGRPHQLAIEALISTWEKTLPLLHAALHQAAAAAPE